VGPAEVVAQLLGRDVFGKTLGILGLGRIGQSVARRARGFGMRLIYSDARRAPARLERELGVRYVLVNRGHYPNYSIIDASIQALGLIPVQEFEGETVYEPVDSVAR